MHRSMDLRRTRMLTALLACGLWWSVGAGANSAAAEKLPRVAGQVFSDPSKPIEVQAGQLFIIALATNPGTGYHWAVATPPDGAVAVLRGTAYQALKTGLMGAPGQELRVYEAIGSGKTTISLNYVSPGSDHTVGKSVRFNVVVAKPN